MSESVDIKSNIGRFQLVKNSLIEKLKNADLTNIAHLSGAVLRDTTTYADSLIVEYLGKPIVIDIYTGDVTAFSEDWRGCGGPLKIKEEIFILHYLLNATGKKPSGHFVPFRSMNGGFFYDSVFQERTIKRFVRSFSKREELFIDICDFLGGVPSRMGGLSVNICVLPHVEIVMLIWKGDEELASSGNILFDDAIFDYFSSEDSVVMAENIVNRILVIDEVSAVKK